MKNYNVEHLFKQENIDKQTECLCQYVCGKNRRIRIHNHDFYEIFLTLSETKHFINGKSEKLSRGALVLIKPSDIHGILYDENSDCEIINFSFSSRLLGLITEYFSISQTFIDSMQSYKIMLSEFETQKLSEKLKTLTTENPDIVNIRTVLFGLLTQFLNTSDYEEKSFPKWFENMCTYMKDPENFIVGVSRMPEISGKSREYIARSFKKFLGITPTEFVNDLRLTFAASRIINTSLNITDICLSSGYESISWFNKMFLNKYGMSPKDFRKKERNHECSDI